MTDYTPEQQQLLNDVRAQLEAANAQIEAMVPPQGARYVGAPGGHWRTPQARVVRFVPPGEIVTQYGTTWFREVPEFYAPKVDIEVSMILGQRDVEFAAFRVTRRRPRGTATVRYFRTDDLWLHGYYVAKTPSEHFPEHVSIYYGDPNVNDVEAAVARWGDPERVTLEQIAIPAGEAI